MSDKLSKTIEYLRQNRQQDLESLFELLRVPSISAQSDRAADCLKCAEMLHERLKSLGFDSRVEKSLGRPGVIASFHVSDELPTLLVYGHYDVQPADPLELWDSDPFEPAVRDGYIYARGASDDKGQMFAWVLAAAACIQSGAELPVNLKFLIEGEEETASQSLGEYIAAHTDELACDCVAISDTSFFNEDTPAITYGLRGIYCCEVTITGPRRDLHSGVYGGIAPNPAHAIAELIASLHNENGDIAIEHLYEDVAAPSARELEIWQSLDVSPESLASEMDCLPLPQNIAKNALMRNWALPALDCNGITAGYGGDGMKTVIASKATAKLSMRLAAGQSADRAGTLLREHLKANCPQGFSIDITDYGGEDPWLMDPESPELAAGREALTRAFGKQCALVRGGASVPITVLIKQLLGRDAVMMGFGLPGDNIHSPNENYPLSHFHNGCEAAAIFMQLLSEQ